MPIFLKIILWILGILIGLICFILFCPIFYQGKVVKKDSELFAKVKANYLLGILSVQYMYPAEDGLRIRILGFRIGKKKAKVEKTRNRKEKKSSTDTNVQTKDETKLETTIEPLSTETVIAPQRKSETVEQDRDQTINEKGSKEEKKPIKERFNEAKKEFTFYKKVLDAEFTKTFLKDAFYRAVKVLKSVLPRSIKGYVKFGANSPDITGYACAGYGILFTRRRFLKHFRFEPNFEEEILEVDVKIKGHISIFYIGIQGLRILFDKRFRRIRRILKKHKEKNNR